MPLYQFKCSCGWEADIAIPLSESDRPVVCVDCGVRARKVFSPTPAIFKGSGFYRNGG